MEIDELFKGLGGMSPETLLRGLSSIRLSNEIYPLVEEKIAEFEKVTGKKFSGEERDKLVVQGAVTYMLFFFEDEDEDEDEAPCENKDKCSDEDSDTAAEALIALLKNLNE